MTLRGRIGLGVVLAVLVGTSACGAPDGRAGPPAHDSLNDDAITVGSFDFAESELLAELYSQALERAGFEVRRAFRLGPREFVAPALEQGLVELLPEYAGTAVQFLSGGAASSHPETGATHETLERTLRGSPLVPLAASPARDANAIVVTRETAERLRLETLTDVRRAAPTLTFGGPPECASRPLCLPGLERVYQVTFDEFVPLDAGGPLTRQALVNGNVDIALLFTTDPAIESDGLVELEDDLRLQPAENVTPIVRRELVERWGDDLVDVIDGVSGNLTTAELRALNARVAREPERMPALVSAWLDDRAPR
jgi:osmoprotectant transport system substrate-binding protein